MTNLTVKFGSCVLTSAVLFAAQPSRAEVTFASKNLTLIVGFTPGGTADADGRFVARHIGKHLPGTPAIIVQNRPGAGGITSVNLAYSSGRPDGLTLYQLSGGHFLQQLAGSKAVRFDLAQFEVVGAWLRSTYVLSVNAAGPFTSVEAIRNAKAPPRIGTQGLGTTTYTYAVAWSGALGFRAELIRGYEGNAQSLALERGEIDARTTTVSNMMERGSSWMEAFPAVVQSGPKRNRDLPNVPTVEELTSDPGPLWRIINGSLTVDRPYVLAPNTPAQITAIYRRAWEDMLVDPDFVKEATARHWQITPTSHAELEALYRRPLSEYPSDVLAKLKEIFP